TEAAKQPSKQLFEEREKKKLRNVPGRGNRRGRDGRRVVNRRHGFVMRDFVVFLALGFKISRPEKIQIQAAGVAHASVILRMLAFRTFENERSVARRAELHAV